MSDLRLLRSAKALTTSVPPHTVVAEGVVSVKGVDLSTTSFVLVNRQPAVFSIISDQQLRVRAGVSDEIIAYSDFYDVDGESEVRIHVGARPSLTTSGVELLRQRVLKALLSDVGSDAFQTLGGGLDKLAGSSVTTRMMSDVIARIRQVETQLLELQRPDEPAASSLTEINILGSEQVDEVTSRVLIEIVNEEGAVISAEV
jgi:hypothetical protein